MKTTPQSVRCRVSRIGCNPLSNQQKETKLTKVSDIWLSTSAAFSDAIVRSKLATGRSSAGGLRTSAFRFRTHCLGVRCVLASLLGLVAVCVSSLAQTPDNVAEREVQRRQAGISQGEAALARGKAAMKAKDYGAPTKNSELQSGICPTQSSPEKRTTKPSKAFAKAESFWPKRASRRTICRCRGNPERDFKRPLRSQVSSGAGTLRTPAAARLFQQNDEPELHREGRASETTAHRGRRLLQFRPVRSCNETIRPGPCS